MSKLTLYDISAEMQALEHFLMEVGGDVSDPQLEAAIDKWLERNQELLADKLDDYGMLIKNREAVMLARSAESKRLAELAAVDENFISRMKGRLKEFFNTHKITKVEATKFKFWVQNNGQRPMLVDEKFDGENAVKLPERYQKQLVIADRAKIKSDLDELEALIAKKELWHQSRKTGTIVEFTVEDEDRMTELDNLLQGVAWYAERGNHLRIK